MTLEELKEKMKEANKTGDKEDAHHTIDYLLLAYIGDVEVAKLYAELEKWYS